ncbi:MAG: transcriptional repressor LexA [Geobacter sp.]|nr:MAG: transcriptional repressor LexA [Geobacter sp.]
MEPEKELTPKQDKVFRFIRERIQQDIPPTIREIARELGFSSTGTVRDYLSALEKKGYLKRKNNLSRAIELLNDNFNKIPIIASIAAGKPDLAYEDIQGYVEPERFLLNAGRGDIFALKVKGESMIEAGIMDGDIAVIRKQKTAANGEIIAALLENNEVTLKKFKTKGSKVFLAPANVNYQPIYKDFTIIGKLITILRKY